MNNTSSFLNQIIRYLPLLILPLFLTGCSLKSSRNTPNNSEQSLTIWRQPVNKKLDDQVFPSLIAAFKKKHPKVKVSYRSFDSTEDYETEVLNALAAGQGPDIWEIRHDELARHKDKLINFPTKTAITVNDFKKVYASSIAEEMISDGKLYGLPMGIDPLILFINKAHLQEADLRDAPKTWEETIAIANTLTRKVDSNIFRPGLALGTASNINHASAIVELLMHQFQTQMVDPARRTATFALYTQDTNGQSFDYPGQNAVAFFKAFADPTSGPYQTWDINQPYSTQAFADGTVSMIIDYLSVGPQLKAINPKLEFTMAYVPQRILRTFPQGDLPGEVSEPVYTARYRALVASKPWTKLSADQQKAKQELAWEFINEATSSTLAGNLNKKTWALSPKAPAVANADQVSDFGSTVNEQSITGNLVTWYKGPSPRSVDKVMTDMTRAITEQSLPIADTMTQAAQIISGLLQWR